MTPVLLVAFILLPYSRALRAASEDLAAQRTLLARERAAVRGARHDAELAQRGLNALAERHSRLFDGANSVAASAELGSYVAERSAQIDVDIQESETRAVPDAPTVASVEIGATGSALDIIGFLRALEQGPKLARADALVITPAPRAGRNDGTLMLRMRVSSLTRRTYGDSALDSTWRAR